MLLVPPVSNLFEFQHFIVTSSEYEARRLVILSILLLPVPSQVVNRRFPAEEARVSGTRYVWSWWWTELQWGSLFSELFVSPLYVVILPMPRVMLKGSVW